MAKIIKITDLTVFIGLDNGTIKGVRKDSISFVPAVDMKVQVIDDGAVTVVTPLESFENVPAETVEEVVVEETVPVVEESTEEVTEPAEDVAEPAAEVPAEEVLPVEAALPVEEAKPEETKSVEKAEDKKSAKKSKKKKQKVTDKLTYIILALTFGKLGIHKFFAGKIFAGIIYLLLGSIPIVSLIVYIFIFFDLIIALCKRADERGNI